MIEFHRKDRGVAGTEGEKRLSGLHVGDEADDDLLHRVGVRFDDSAEVRERGLGVAAYGDLAHGIPLFSDYFVPFAAIAFGSLTLPKPDPVRFSERLNLKSRHHSMSWAPGG